MYICRKPTFNQIMNDLFVPYDIAVKINKKGFTESGLRFYDSNKQLKETLGSEDLQAPLYQQVIDWLREWKDVHLYIKYNRSNNTYIYFIEHEFNIDHGKSHNLYYEALEAGVRRALDIIS